jgi:hypothetical protein
LKLYVICQRVVILYKLDLFFPVYWKLSAESYSSRDYNFYILLGKLSININNQHKYNLLILVLIFYSLKTILCVAGNEVSCHMHLQFNEEIVEKSAMIYTNKYRLEKIAEQECICVSVFKICFRVELYFCARFVPP